MDKPSSKTALSAAKSWLKQQRHYAGHLLTLSMVCSIVAGFCLIAQAALLAHVVSQIMFAESHWQQQQTPLLALLALMLCRVLLSKYTEQFAFRGASEIKLALRKELYLKLTQLGPSYVEQQHSAALSEVLHTGVEALESYYARYLPAVAFCAIMPLAILAVVLPVDWLTGLIFLVTAPLVPLFMILIGLKAEQLNQKHWQQLSRMSNHFLDILQGLAQLKLFNASRAESAAIASIADQYRRSTMSILKVAFLSSLALEFLATMSIAMVAITVGFRLYWGELDFSVGFMLLLLAPEFYLPFRNLGQAYHAKMKGVAAAQQMLQILQATPLRSGTKIFTESADKHLSISYQQVSFAYPEQRQALHNLSLKIESPGLYAIIGPSGAGKSTMIDTLLGFLQPSEGCITINGEDLAQLERASWQQQLAWVPQNPQLIYGSLLQNIQLADPSASMAQVKAAATKAGVDQFIDQLEHGWQQPIGERGAGISGGQRQRIAMARVFLKQAPILILDEPSAHLDADTQRWLVESLNDYAQQHTVIVIAHRLQSIQQAKTIFLLNQGTLSAQGSHSDLQLHSSLYRELIAADAGAENVR